MASMGSYIRFGLGILLSIEVIRIFIMGSGISELGIILASLFLLSSVIFFAKKIMK